MNSSKTENGDGGGGDLLEMSEMASSRADVKFNA